MNFDEALKKLGIEDYSERIFHSNSHGELFHLMDYVCLAQSLEEYEPGAFREWFDGVVKQAEETWNRPESIFQHIYSIVKDNLPDNKSLDQN